MISVFRREEDLTALFWAITRRVAVIHYEVLGHPIGLLRWDG